MASNEHWKMMMEHSTEFSRAVVSGSSGFLGRRLARLLASSGVSVLGIDPGPSPFSMKMYRHRRCSLDRASGLVVQHLRGGGVFFHMVGLADREECEKRPDDAFALNVGLAFEALKICGRIGGVKFVLPSTGIVYGLHLDRPAVESDPVRPAGVYVGTKLAAEFLVQGYGPGRLQGAVVARLSNVYGPGVGENTVLGRLLGQASRRENLGVMDPRPVRDFIHVDDVVEALVRLASPRIEKTVVVNVSTATGTKIGSAAGILAGITGLGVKTPVPVSAGPASRLVLDNSLLGKIVGWVPRVHIEEGLKMCSKCRLTSNSKVRNRI